ncbi:methyltransferase domain-containing protein [Deinococcus sp.]|uniref:class I SAM-dependent methyltransferase n=1 Tax=Deinococcus sp. TaxID=47478 RepID=UPI0025FE4C49|nr:methyltransferase domain-containing protein [Deinococcus sp.]
MTTDDALARRCAELPLGAASILSARTLASDYPALARELRPGLRLLDVGCGTGAMTLGMAQAVFPAQVIGLDMGAALLDQARARGAAQPNLSANLRFVEADLYDLPYGAEFDVVVAARVLQWLGEPLRAVRELSRVLRPGGRLFVLDYQHFQAQMVPPVPPSVAHFRARFLAWRAAAGLPNAPADELESWLHAAGLHAVQSEPQLETARRGAPDFGRRIAVWGTVIASRGHQVVAAGHLSEAERALAEQEFSVWAQERAESQVLALRSASGMKGGG